MTKRTYRGTLAVAALVAAVAILAAACGGGSDTVTTAASSATTAADDDSAQSGSIVVSGLVDYPMTFTAVDMDYMDWVTATADDPTSGFTSYDGVHLSDIWSFLGVQTDAKTVTITGADGTTADVTLADISGDALLAVADDGSFNMVMPGMGAQAWVKAVVTMDFK
jgi:hypothetical protein